MQPNNINWPPAKSVKDSKAPPSHFNASGISANLLQSAVNMLMQQAKFGPSNSSKETRVCFNCNEPGHLASNCPKPKKKKGPGNNNKLSSSTKKNKNPRFIPPDESIKPVSHQNGEPVFEKRVLSFSGVASAKNGPPLIPLLNTLVESQLTMLTIKLTTLPLSLSV
jgi:hypothetical protein